MRAAAIANVTVLPTARITSLSTGRPVARSASTDDRLQSAFEDGTVLPWWTDHARTVAEWSTVSAADARTFDSLDKRLKQLVRYLQPFFLEIAPIHGDV